MLSGREWRRPRASPQKWNQNWNQFGPFWLWFHFFVVTTKRLTDPVLKMHLRSPPSGHLALSDGAIPGLSVRVGTKGTASWSLLIRVAGEGRDQGERKAPLGRASTE